MLEKIQIRYLYVACGRWLFHGISSCVAVNGRGGARMGYVI